VWPAVRVEQAQAVQVALAAQAGAITPELLDSLGAFQQALKLYTQVQVAMVVRRELPELQEQQEQQVPRGRQQQVLPALELLLAVQRQLRGLVKLVQQVMLELPEQQEILGRQGRREISEILLL
jgi:hypothetical protein